MRRLDTSAVSRLSHSEHSPTTKAPLKDGTSGAIVFRWTRADSASEGHVCREECSGGGELHPLILNPGPIEGKRPLQPLYVSFRRWHGRCGAVRSDS